MRKALDAAAMARAEEEAELRLKREAEERERAVAEAEARAIKMRNREQGIYTDEDKASVRQMQRAWRARKARNQMRRMLASLWRKGFDTESGQYYYENTVTGAMQFERPHMLAKLFPGSNF